MKKNVADRQAGKCGSRVRSLVTPAMGSSGSLTLHPIPPPWNLVLESEGNEECALQKAVPVSKERRFPPWAASCPASRAGLTSRALGAGLRCWAGPMAYVA